MKKVFLWWLIAGSKGGENRGRIILELNKRPYNANKLAEKLSLDYKTIRHHIDVLKENNLVKSTGRSMVHYISSLMRWKKIIRSSFRFGKNLKNYDFND